MTKETLAERIALAGRTEFTGTMSAKEQRAIFGANLFGNKRFTIDARGEGRVAAHWVRRQSGARSISHTFEQFAAFIRAGYSYHEVK